MLTFAYQYRKIGKNGDIFVFCIILNYQEILKIIFPLKRIFESHIKNAFSVKFEPLVVVGIVGWAHLAGIERIWSKPE